MSKYQPSYDKEKKKEIRIMVPEIDDQIRDFENTRRSTKDPDVRKALEARIKALKIKKKSYKSGDPVKESNVEEEAQGAVTTGSVGVPTMGDGKGGTEPAIYGNSSIYAKHMGTMSRRGEYKAPDHCDCKKKKKKKKKTQKEFVEFYFENEQ